MFYSAFYLGVWFAGSAMMVKEGLWSNTITLFNILISGLVAFGFYGPLAIFIDEKLNGEFTYVLDFVCIWGLFVISMVLLGALTKLASKSRMRFKNPIDPTGSTIMGELASWVLAAFVMATLHTAPMPGVDAFSGGLEYTEQEVDEKWALFNPDLGWLRFVERVSQSGALGRAQGDFSAKAFVKIYADHREKLEKAPGITVRRG
jgi:hypothetical protein